MFPNYSQIWMQEHRPIKSICLPLPAGGFENGLPLPFYSLEEGFRSKEMVNEMLRIVNEMFFQWNGSLYLQIHNVFWPAYLCCDQKEAVACALLAFWMIYVSHCHFQLLVFHTELPLLHCWVWNAPLVKPSEKCLCPSTLDSPPSFQCEAAVL